MTTSFPLQPGTVLRDRYILQEILHSGYWSLTLRALRQDDGQPVTLKIPGPGNAASGVNIAFHAAWMQRVFHGLSQYHHPNRAAVLDYFETHGFPVLVQQDVVGTPLSQRLLQKPLEEGEAIALVRKIAIALSSIHGKGLIHRDVRPETILEQAQTHQPVLVDWGLQPSVFPANRASSYAAPEQFQTGGRFQPTIDVYGLAATLYALVTGQPPIHAALRPQTPLVLPRQIQPKLSLALERAILQGMESNPQERPPSMGAWLALLPEVVAPVTAPVMVPVTAPVTASATLTAPPTPPVPVATMGLGEAMLRRAARASDSPQPAGLPRSTSALLALTTPALSASPMFPVKILALISLTTALVGGCTGLLLRVAPPASLAGISGLGRTQTFPAIAWPGGGTAQDLSLDLPAPDSPPDRDASLPGKTRQSLQDKPAKERTLREVIPPEFAEEAPVFEPILEPESTAPSAEIGGDRPLGTPEIDPPDLNAPPPAPEPAPSFNEAPVPPADFKPAPAPPSEPAPSNNSEPIPADIIAPEPVSAPELPAPIEPEPAAPASGGESVPPADAAPPSESAGI